MFWRCIKFLHHLVLSSKIVYFCKQERCAVTLARSFCPSFTKTERLPPFYDDKLLKKSVDTKVFFYIQRERESQYVTWGVSVLRLSPWERTYATNIFYKAQNPKQRRGCRVMITAKWLDMSDMSPSQGNTTSQECTLNPKCATLPAKWWDMWVGRWKGTVSPAVVPSLTSN